MSNNKRVFTGRNVVLSDGQPRPATVIADAATGKITAILHKTSIRSDFPDIDHAHFIDAGDKYILPGLVEYVLSPLFALVLTPILVGSAHVHLNEPGRTDWEGFWTGTRAAASGGVTTVVDMPLNSIPPTTTVANLEAKRSAARGQCWTDVAFWGGVIPHNQVSTSCALQSIPHLSLTAHHTVCRPTSSRSSTQVCAASSAS